MELEHYNQNKLLLEQMRDEIIDGQKPISEVKSNGGLQGNPTQNKAVRLASSTSILWLERSVGSIDRAMQKLDNIHRQIFALRYQEGVSCLSTCEMIPIARTTFFRRRMELLELVAIEMGKKSWD